MLPLLQQQLLLLPQLPLQLRVLAMAQLHRPAWVLPAEW
jgi:hypothetical protein